MSTNNLRNALGLALGLLLAWPAITAAAPRRNDGVDLCLVNRTAPGANPLNTLVLQDVAPLEPGRSVALQGIYFSSALRTSAIAGSAMMAADGSVRLGLFVHASAEPGPNGAFRNDFTLSGVTDASFAGSLFYDNDGDFLPNGEILFEVEDCATIVVP